MKTRSVNRYVACRARHFEPGRRTEGSAAARCYVPGLLTLREDEWLHGWDPTPGIVSVWAEANGQAWVWRREPHTRALVCESERFRPWLLLATLADVQHLGARLEPHGEEAPPSAVTYEE